MDIERGLLDLRPGQKTDVLIRRGGQESSLALTVQSVPLSVPGPGEQVWRLLGLKAVPVSPEYVAAVSNKLRGGLYVHAVAPGSPAARAAIQKGDILVGMNVGQRHWETIRPDNILFILDESRAARSQTIHFYLIRRNMIQNGALTLSDGFMAHTTNR